MLYAVWLVLDGGGAAGRRYRQVYRPCLIVIGFKQIQIHKKLFGVFGKDVRQFKKCASQIGEFKER